MLILIAACSKPAPVPEPAAAEPAREAPAPSWAGEWHSASCGERTYPRNLILQDGGAATLEELISPCPPGAQCVWSGVHVIEGTWSVDGDTVKLDVSAPSGGPPAIGLPSVLTWKGAPAQGDCVYEAGLAK
ncbi:MAG: hypothetical protein KC656_23405 [Myxococcales bacterium]|nr:hypothetical protein [Myxococcales bacterium]MCB9670847.1 hypothetical protein [Alphaproteobacteria bacterium]MCB9691080.1 hypothetical protein [Alphaproteobacteria bacterium]